MRQIRFCAQLLLIPLAATACSGEAFRASDSSAGNGSAPETSGGAPSRNHAGASGSSSGMVQLGGSGKSGSAGAASGGATTAGGAAAGGMSTAGDSAYGSDHGAGGSSEDACLDGAITFRMLPSPDLEPSFLCDAGCGTGWLTITDPQGATAFSIFSACGTASCESCEILACAAAACLPRPLTSEGSELVWSGTYLAKDTCGANMACQRQACVKPGKYKAKACAAINGGSNANGACMAKNEQLCTETEFEFPATSTVKLLLKK